MKRVFASITTALVFALCLGSFSPRPCLAAEDQAARFETMTYAEKIVYLDEGTRNLLTVTLIGGVDPFRKLSNEASQNIENSLAFLSDPGRSWRQKQIAILSMQELGLQDYLRFLRGVIDLSGRDLTSKYLLQFAWSPPEDYSHLFIINYQDKGVRDILTEIRARPETDDSSRKLIDDILSGKALEGMIEFKRDCCGGSTKWTHLPKRPWTGFENSSTYSEKIIAIDKAVIRVVADNTLLGFKPFDDLSDEGVKNIDECLKFLAAGGQIRQQRPIAILSMHELGGKDYVHFIQELIALSRRGLVTEAELDLALSPGLNFSDVLFVNFHDKSVQDLFRVYYARPGAPPGDQKALDEFLSGKNIDALIASAPKTKLLTPPE